MKKTLTVLIMVLIVAILFVACNSNPNTDNSSSATQGGGSSSGDSSGSSSSGSGDSSSSGGSSSSGSGDSSGGAGDSSSNTWTVTFDLVGGTCSGLTLVQQVTKNTAVSKPTTNPTKDNYMFMGWVKDGETTAYNFENSVTSNITIKATWEAPTAEEYINSYYVYFATRNANMSLYSYLKSENNSEVNITEEIVSTKSDQVKEALTSLFTEDSKRFEVTSVKSSTAKGKIVSTDEAENVYISFTYKCQTKISNNEGGSAWQDDSGATEQTGYLAYSYKATDDKSNNSSSVTNFKSNIVASSLSELPTVSNNTVKEYKEMVAYSNSSEELTSCTLGGATLPDAEFQKVKTFYSNLGGE